MDGERDANLWVSAIFGIHFGFELDLREAEKNWKVVLVRAADY